MLTHKVITKEDLVEFVPLPYQYEEYQTVIDILDAGLLPDAHMFYDNGIPVAIVSVYEKWPKVFDTMTVFSIAWTPKCFKYVIKYAKAYIDNMDYDRIEHIVRCNRPWTDKMARAFGFKFCALMRKYYAGQDVKLYEIVR